MALKINLKFEKNNYDARLSYRDNLFRENFSNFSKYKFCRPSQVVEIMADSSELLGIEINVYCVKTDIEKYIISTAVMYNPTDWASSNPSIFEILNSDFLNDLRNKKAILLIDQSVEGYQFTWLWQWFHKKCKEYNIEPSSIIYLTGNQLAIDQYNVWCNQQLISGSKLKIISSTSLYYYVYQTYFKNSLDIKFDRLLSYKSANDIKLFNCTNLRPRIHRIINFLHLVKFDLISDGIISIGDSAQWALTGKKLSEFKLSSSVLSTAAQLSPMTVKSKQNNTDNYVSYIERILDDVYENTWVSVITESSYFDYENTVFISEKTFKAIACMHPFIIVGSRYSLMYLRKLGYKTFDGFIDESYDTLPDNKRFSAIMHSLKKIKKIKDKLYWYQSMREILEHNHALFLSMHNTQQKEHIEIMNHYRNF